MSVIRAAFPLVVPLLVLLAAGTSRAQTPKPARVGVLASSTESNFAPSVKVFQESLRAAGWIEGRDLTLEDRIGVLVNGANPVTAPIVRATETAAQKLRMKLHVVDSVSRPI